MEIKRVAKMPEPDRTFRALSLWDAWKDATCVIQVLSRYRKRQKKEPKPDPIQYKEDLRRERIEALLRSLVKKSIGTLPTDERPPLRPYAEP